MRSFLTALTLVASSLALAVPSFRGLGVEDGYTSSRFVGLSGDGRVAAGDQILDGAGSLTMQAFFSDSQGTHDVGWLPGSGHQSRVVGLDADGSHLFVTAIRGDIAAGGSFTVGIATLGGTLQDLGGVSGADGLYGRAVATNRDALYVQASHDGGYSPSTSYRWTSAGGFVPVTAPGAGAFSVVASSADDSGMAVTFNDRAMRWDGAAWSVLDSAFGPNVDVSGVTNGGDFVAGTATTADWSAREAVLWDHGTALDLGDLDGGGLAGQSLGLSEDGRYVVGAGTETHWEYQDWLGGFLDVGQDAAWLWTANGGMRTVASLLDEAGVNYSGWTLTSANAVVSQGGLLTIGGNGVDPFGRNQGWVATLGGGGTQPVPEPASLAALGLGALVLIRRRRARS